MKKLHFICKILHLQGSLLPSRKDSWIVCTCCDTADSMRSSRRLNSSKQPHAPTWHRPTKIRPMAYKKTEIKLGRQTILKMRDENGWVCFGCIFFFDMSFIFWDEKYEGLNNRQSRAWSSQSCCCPLCCIFSPERKPAWCMSLKS